MLEPDLEITIRQDAGEHYADLRFTSPVHDVVLATGAPVALDPAALRALELDPDGYGRRLTGDLFAEPSIRAAWQQARAVAAQHGALRVRLRLDGAAPELHALRWELLRDPEDDAPLALSERIRLSRYLDSRDFTPLAVPLRPDLRALVAVANPRDLAAYGLAEVDVDGEVARAQAALGDLPTTIIGGHPAAQQPHATLATIAAALRDGPQLALLIAHGSLIDGEPYLWLERDDGMADRVDGASFVQTIAQLPRRPLLLVLAACQSGGRGYADTLAALGPRLAQAGVAGVLAFQGLVPMGTVRALLPPLFSELRRDGSIDRAVAAARGALRRQADWWTPVLWMRARDGQLWHMEEPAAVKDDGRRTTDPSAALRASDRRSTTDDQEGGQPPAGPAPATQLRQLLATYFNDGELRTLCFDLGIDYESLPGAGKADKARELVAYVQRHRQETQLLAECRRLRPLVAWPAGLNPAAAPPALGLVSGWDPPASPHPNPSPTRIEGLLPHQDADSPPSPLVGEGGRGEEGDRAVGHDGGITLRVNVTLEPPEGTMRPDSPFYIERQPADRVAVAAVRSPAGMTLTIKGPRQVGKSSLLTRVMAAAVEAGKQVAYLDFQQFDEGARADSDTFFLQFARWLADEVGLAAWSEADWPLALGTVQRCTRYVERALLPALGAPLLLAMDEVDSILDCPFRSDFFAMLRVWHNNRAMPNRPIWRKLDLALVTSTEPYELVQNLHQSPFNVGEVIDLVDFDPAQVAQLNALHGRPLSERDTARLAELLAGHPYLTRRAFYLVADGRLTSEALFNQAPSENGPFGEHLRRHGQRLSERPELAQAFRQILLTGRATDDRAFWRLRGAGLVRREGERSLARCRLYTDYFTERLR